ncbi:MAG: hypothetical protein RQ842_11230 [Vulcanisaeta sp.]|nr:hypothetical protein [Vulcanisaeta sp.]
MRGSAPCRDEPKGGNNHSWVNGVIASVTSIIIAIRTKDWRAGLISVYNVGALIYDMWEYLGNVGDAVKDIVEDLGRDEDSAILALIIVVGLALAIGFIITYAAYRAGRDR